MCSAVVFCELVMLGYIVPNEEEPANNHLAADLFQALTPQSVGQRLPVSLSAARETVPVAVAIKIADEQDASILHHNRLGRYPHLLNYSEAPLQPVRT